MLSRKCIYYIEPAELNQHSEIIQAAQQKTGCLILSSPTHKLSLPIKCYIGLCLGDKEAA